MVRHNDQYCESPKPIESGSMSQVEPRRGHARADIARVVDCHERGHSILLGTHWFNSREELALSVHITWRELVLNVQDATHAMLFAKPCCSSGASPHQSDSSRKLMACGLSPSDRSFYSICMRLLSAAPSLNPSPSILILPSAEWSCFLPSAGSF